MRFRNPFRRKRPASPPSLRIVRLKLGDTPDDWAVGDKAICVLEGPWVELFTRHEAPGPKNGQTLAVARVTMELGAQCLGFAEFGDRNYLAVNFLKVRPDEREACTDAFRKLLKRQPERVGA